MISISYEEAQKMIKQEGFRGIEKVETQIKNFFGKNQSYQREGNILLSRQIIPFVQLFGTDFKEKVILDLGCGSNESSYGGLIYEPWLCRALTNLGARVIGVDIQKNDEEIFSFYRKDLTENNCLSFLSDSSIDIAHAGGLFNLPDVSDVKLKNSLLPQLERIVRPEGIFLYQN